MRADQLRNLLREVGRISGRREIVVIGSQALHALPDAPPVEVVISRECDLLFDEDEAAAEVQARLGPQSEFHAAHGYYIDIVPPGIPVLPEGWRDRLVPLDAGSVVASCLEVTDLAVAKLAAGRLKDYELVASLLQRGRIQPSVVADRIATFGDVRLRAILLARLQVTQESVGRN
jgi:hypothetical protein